MITEGSVVGINFSWFGKGTLQCKNWWGSKDRLDACLLIQQKSELYLVLSSLTFHVWPGCWQRDFTQVILIGCRVLENTQVINPSFNSCCHLVAGLGSTGENKSLSIKGPGWGDKRTHQGEDKGKVGLLSCCCEPQGGAVWVTWSRTVCNIGMNVHNLLDCL